MIWTLLVASGLESIDIYPVTNERGVSNDRRFLELRDSLICKHVVYYDAREDLIVRSVRDK